MKDRDPGIKLHPHPTFENRRARLGILPDLNLRWAFVGTRHCATSSREPPKAL